MGSSCSPLLGIWKKWSMTDSEAKPASSAEVAISRSFGARVDASASHFQRLRCSPSFTCTSVLMDRRSCPNGVRSPTPTNEVRGLQVGQDELIECCGIHSTVFAKDHPVLTGRQALDRVC